MGSLRVRLWGTRGLISSPRPETAFFGGNTTCIQIMYRDELILVDTGFGAANLGDALVDGKAGKPEGTTAHILYTHFHWDHVQGLPFFKPIYFPSTKIHIYSPERPASTLENLNVLFDGSYSPFESLLTMQASVELHQLAGETELGGLKVAFHPVDHGEHGEHGETYAYRFSSPEGNSVCIVTDHEARAASTRNKQIVAFAKGCDLLIHDGQYTDEEYAAHKGWGHSSARMALENALRIEAGATLLTHHHPSHDDRDLQRLHRELLQTKKFRALDYELAREDVVYVARRTRSFPKAG